MNNIYASIFGESEATKKARENRDTAFQAMLDSRRQATEKQRTDDVKMARWNAFGNLLTTMVQPLGWAVGGRGTGVTGGVQKYDDRQYISAFNRAVKATDDLRNIGTMEDEYRFNLANEDYKRSLAIDDEARRRQQSYEDAERKAAIQAKYAEQRHGYTMDEIAARGDVQKELADLKARYRVTRGGLSVDDRALISARNNYEQYKRTKITQGQPYLTFEQYMQGEGYDLKPNGGTTAATEKPSSAPATTQKPSQAKPAEKKGGFKTGGTAPVTTTTTTQKAGKTGGFKL